MYTGWRKCKKCGGDKKVDYQPNCEDCRLEELLPDFWAELESWRTYGMPEFKHVPGIILSKLNLRQWEEDELGYN